MPNSLFMVVSWYNEDLLDEAGLAYPGPAPFRLELGDAAHTPEIDDRPRRRRPARTVGLDRQSAAWEQFANIERRLPVRPALQPDRVAPGTTCASSTRRI